jgi:hypothetical protein
MKNQPKDTTKEKKKSGSQREWSTSRCELLNNYYLHKS